MKPTATADQRRFYMEALCFQPMAGRYDFSKSQAERDVIAAYEGQLGKAKHHKFKTVLKIS